MVLREPARAAVVVVVILAVAVGQQDQAVEEPVLEGLDIAVERAFLTA